jgi:UV DNA damage endonuclease
MIHLGVATKILSAKRARQPMGAHLSVRLLALREALLYLAERQVRCYRLPDDLISADAHGAAWQQELHACQPLLDDLASLAQAHAIRMTMHVPLYAVLATPDDAVATRAFATIGARAALLDALGCGADGTLVVHAGGAYGDDRAARERFAMRWEALPEVVRRRVAIEPDEDCFDLAALLPLHQMTGAPIVFDMLHFQLHNPLRISLEAALGLALATWPPGVRPKVHVSTQRTEAHMRAARDGRAQQVVPPRHGQHADFVNPFEFVTLLQAARGLPAFDIMLEAKAGDLALLRLREDVRQFAPEFAGCVN